MKPLVLSALLASAAFAQIPASADKLPGAERERAIWNDIFQHNKMKFRAEASAFVKRAVAGTPPGRALDLGMGTGRNALYLASEKWDVTGVDVSDVALKQANAAAQSAGLKIKTIDSSLDSFDPGREQWDLIVLSYMQFWIANASPEALSRITASLKPGGLLVIEGFAAEDAPGGPKMGFPPNGLLRLFEPGLTVKLYEDLRKPSDWKLGTTNRVMRLVAQR